MLQWSGWTRLPRYFYDDPAMDAAARAARVQLPLVLGFDDDPWANRRAIDLLMRPLVNAQVERRQFAPSAVGLPAIGHMGKRSAAALWRRMAAEVRMAPHRFGYLLNRRLRLAALGGDAPRCLGGHRSAQVGLLFLLESRRNARDRRDCRGAACGAGRRHQSAMQASGLIERAGDQHDGHHARLQLTAAGASQPAVAPSAAELNGHQSGFRDAELAVVARWLEQAATLEDQV
jgi:hypothetical protein